MSEIWKELEQALMALGNLKSEDIKGTSLEGTALETLFKDGDLAPEEMAVEMTDAIREILDAKKGK